MKALGSFGGLVAQCQAVQKETGILEFFVVPAASCDEAGRSRIARFLDDIVPRYYGAAVTHRVSFAESIPHRGRKFLEFVSEIEQKD
jgi:hypothetical protein